MTLQEVIQVGLRVVKIEPIGVKSTEVSICCRFFLNIDVLDHSGLLLFFNVNIDGEVLNIFHKVVAIVVFNDLFINLGRLVVLWPEVNYLC